MKAIWNKYTATANGNVTISSNLPTNIAPKSTDTGLSVATGTCGALVCTSSNDDISATNYLSETSFAVTSGTTYYIQWDNYYSALGFDFSFTYSAGPPPCNPVTTIFLASNVTANSATLNWAAPATAPASYDIEYGITGFALGTGTNASSATNSLNLTGLSSNAIYDFYIRSVCSITSTSTWSAVSSFALLQVPPYTSGFDSGSQLAGWSVLGTAGQYGLGTTAANAQGGAQYWIFQSNTTATSNNRLFTPGFALTSGQTINVSFWVRSPTASNRSLRLTVGNATTAAGQATEIWANTAINSPTYSQNNATYTVPSTGTYYFAFHDITPTAAAVGTLRLDTVAITSNSFANDTFSSINFQSFPNPVKDILNLSYDKNITAVSVINLLGQEVLASKLNSNDAKIDMSSLTAGAYMVKISSDNEVKTIKVIKE